MGRVCGDHFVIVIVGAAPRAGTADAKDVLGGVAETPFDGFADGRAGGLAPSQPTYTTNIQAS